MNDLIYSGGLNSNMKPTRIKVSVSQDGLLPQETADVATVELPALPKKILRALGFEKVDANTFVGVLPVFVNLGDEQEIEIELGVGVPEMRKRVLEILTTPQQDSPQEKEQETETTDSKKKSPSSRSTKKSKSSKTSDSGKSAKAKSTGSSKSGKSSKSSKTSNKSSSSGKSSKTSKSTKKTKTSKSTKSKAK